VGGYKKHDNKKLPASTRWAVEALIFFCGWILTKAVPHGIGGDKLLSQTKRGNLRCIQGTTKSCNLFFSSENVAQGTENLHPAGCFLQLKRKKVIRWR